jgi:hypothetical protein
MMAAAGVGRIQPGIESLSTNLLRYMKKGTTLLHNLSLLKWCVELKIATSWNILYGFPGEPVEEYRKMADLLPVICHFPPPSGGGIVQLVRFGPMWKEPGKFGVDNVQPFWSVPLIYPGLSAEDLQRIALFFTYNRRDGVDPEEYIEPILDGILQWFEANKRGATLEIYETTEGWILKDTRGLSPIEERLLSQIELRVLKALDSSKTRDRLLDALNQEAGNLEPRVSSGELDFVLDLFFLQQCVVEDEGRLLSLVLDRSEFCTIPGRGPSVVNQ